MPPALEGAELCSAPFPPALAFAWQLAGKKCLEFSVFTRFCTRHIVQICWVPPASPPGKGYQEAATASERSLSKWPHFGQVLEMQARIFPMGHLEGKELMAGGGWRMVSCPSPAQTNIPQGPSCPQQARNAITTSFHASFSLVSVPNRTTGSLEAAAQSSVPLPELCQPYTDRKTSPAESQGAGGKAEHPQQPPGPHLCPTRCHWTHPGEQRAAGGRCPRVTCQLPPEGHI